MRSAEAQAHFSLTVLQAPAQSSPQVVLLRVERGKRGSTWRTAQICGSPPALCEGQEEFGVLAADDIELL
jgi:hypothetical protein